jgi:hypothetical protein
MYTATEWYQRGVNFQQQPFSEEDGCFEEAHEGWSLGRHRRTVGHTRGTTAATPGFAASPCPTTGASTPSAWRTTGMAWPFPASRTAELAGTTRPRHARTISVRHYCFVTFPHV